MSYIYSEDDYFGIVDDEYQRYDFLIARVEQVGNRLNAYINATNLIAGAGFGYTIQMLMDFGFQDVWGVEASSFAVNTMAPQAIPNHSHRLILGDVTSRNDLNNVRGEAGLRGNQSFRVTLTEDLLPCAENEDEVQTMLSELRRISQTLGHIVTPARSNSIAREDGARLHPVTNRIVQMPGFLWLSMEEWRQLIGPGEILLNSETGEEY